MQITAVFRDKHIESIKLESALGIPTKQDVLVWCSKQTKENVFSSNLEPNIK